MVLSLIVASFAAILSTIPTVSATEYLMDSHDGASSGYIISYIYSANASATGIGASAGISERFTSNTVNRYITHISAELKKVGSPDGDMYCFLFDADYNLIEISSDFLEISSLGTTNSWRNWTFSGTTIVEVGVYLRFAFVITSANTLSGSHYVNFAYGNSVSDVRLEHLYAGAWTYVNSNDISYAIYGEDTPQVTPTPTPNPTGGGVPVGTAQLIVDAYADCNVSWRIQGQSAVYYEGVFNLPVGTVIEMTLTPDEGYYFDYWWAIWIDGSTELYVNPLHFTLYYDLSITGFADAAEQSYEVLTLQNGAGGRVYADYSPENWTGAIRFFAGTYAIATNTTLSIGGLPYSGYQFYRTTFEWDINGVVLSNVEYDNPFTVSIIGTLTAKAYFTAGSLYPTVSPGGSGDTLGTVLTLLTSQAMISLFIMVIVGFVCYLMAGAWGFFAGLNVSAIMLLLAGVLDLWAIIVLAIVDGLLLYGKVSASKSTDVKGD